VGQLDEARFTEVIACCASCHGRSVEVWTYLDQQVSVMLADANDDGRWIHDGEKFIDGVFRVCCAGCRTELFAAEDCPRCHRIGVLEDVLASDAGVPVPRRCPGCKGLELMVTALVPARVRTGAGKVVPTAIAALGEPGFHVAAVVCEACDWHAAAEGCPLCAGPGPLRPRP
jgi:hypothetical protein